MQAATSFVGGSCTVAWAFSSVAVALYLLLLLSAGRLRARLRSRPLGRDFRLHVYLPRHPPKLQLHLYSRRRRRRHQNLIHHPLLNPPKRSRSNQTPADCSCSGEIVLLPRVRNWSHSGNETCGSSQSYWENTDQNHLIPQAGSYSPTHRRLRSSRLQTSMRK